MPAPPGAFVGSVACQHPGLGPAASRAVRRSSCCFTPHGVWPLATAAPGCRALWNSARETAFLKEKKTNNSGSLLWGESQEREKDRREIFHYKSFYTKVFLRIT